MVKAYGSFIKKGSNTFRTEAFIQWGDSEERIGTVLMLNPGAAALKKHNATYGELIQDQLIQDELTTDATMNCLKELVEEMYEGRQLQGRVYIYNLFTLCNSSSEGAVKQFTELYEVEKSLLCDFPKSREILLEEIKKSSWILVGWGCIKGTANLRKLKENWMKLINESEVCILGKQGQGKENWKWYHPKPQIKRDQIAYKKEVVKQFRIF